MGPQSEGTLVFRDGSEQWSSSFSGSHDPTRDVTVLGDLALTDFFSRPVKIVEYAWDPAAASPFFALFDPWTLFLSNPRVSNRISNYRLMSAKMHVKVLINGNPFYFGRMMCHYTPLSAYDNVSPWTSTNASTLVQASQTLHAYIDPCTSQGCELELPFVWFYDMIDLTLGEQSKLGTMYLREMYDLKHANGSIDPLAIQVFAWMSDVKLSVPTLSEPTFLTPQAGRYNSGAKGRTNEYASSPISTVASAAAAVMGKLATVPIIGGYAKASEMVMSGVAGLARAFGFSRPAMIADYMDIRPSIISRLAVTNAGDNVAKLTTDGKQELSIDPAIVGIGDSDELVLTSIASKESYLNQFVWTTAANPGALLFSIRVAPIWLFSTSNYYLPAITYAALPFKYWHGSIKYRFQIVASAYHRGRLMIVWDPLSQTSAPETNIQYSKIVDLANERDFTFEVGWGAPTRWLERPVIAAANYSSTALPFSTNLPNSFNGVVSVYVLNDLTSPNSLVDNNIGVNVFISGCDDIEFAVPDHTDMCRAQSLPSLTPQSGTFDESVEEMENAPIIEDSKEIIADCLPKNDACSLVYMGEKITSFRQMLKRYSLWSSFYDSAATAQYTRYAGPDFPGARGYDINGTLINGVNNYNASLTTPLNYLSFAYMAYRGGIRRKYILTSGFSGNLMAFVNRISATYSTSAPAVSAVPKTVTSGLIYSQAQVNTIKPRTYTGAHATSIRQQPAVEVELPFYTNARFVSPRAVAFVGTDTRFGPLGLAHEVIYEHDAAPTSFDVFVAGAEDSTFIGFQGCCPLRFPTSV